MATEKYEALRKAIKAAEAEQARPAGGADADSITDIAPAGALTIGGLPARALSAADLRIVGRYAAAVPDADEIEMMQVLVYCAVQPDLGALWRLARDPAALGAAVMAWAGGIPIDAFASMVRDAAPLWREFARVSEVLASAGDDAEKKTAAAVIG